MKTNNCKTSTHSTLRGFSLAEILVTIASISTLCGIGMVAVNKTQEAGQRSKLESDVATLNRGVRVYLGNGGKLPAEATASEVLGRLKRKVAAGEASQLVGHTGPFVDPRITGVAAATNKGTVRAVWNGTTNRFVVGTAGAGISEFVLDSKLATQPVETESRETVTKFAKREAWVWDYDGNEVAAVNETPTESEIAPGTPVLFSPEQGPTKPGRLQPPTVSVPPGLYEYAEFPMPVTLSNPNPDGSSRLFYSINNGAWAVYAAGTVLNLPADQLNSTLQTYAAPLNGEQWIDSTTAAGLYQTIFFRGSTGGVFTNPAGDSGLVTNLSKKLKLKSSHFEWGSPTAGQPGPNTLDFAGVSSFFALPEQEFKIGDLSYYNGTTFSGTNATSVEMEVKLNLSVPLSTETLEFSLELKSTTNHKEDPNVDADYVWIPKLSSQFSTTVQGQTFYLQLRFGPSDANSFTTIDEFHVHENKQATGAIYGKMTTRPID